MRLTFSTRMYSVVPLLVSWVGWVMVTRVNFDDEEYKHRVHAHIPVYVLCVVVCERNPLAF